MAPALNVVIFWHLSHFFGGYIDGLKLGMGNLPRGILGKYIAIFWVSMPPTGRLGFLGWTF